MIGTVLENAHNNVFIPAAAAAALPARVVVFITLDPKSCFLTFLTLSVQELFDPLHLMYRSLMTTGDESTANHKLLDVLRQVRWCVADRVSPTVTITHSTRVFLVASHARPCLLHPHSLNAQVQTFGLSLTQLDIRQESTRHAEVCVCGGGGDEREGC